VLRLTKATCLVKYLTSACLSYNWQRQITFHLFVIHRPHCVSFLSSTACFASRTACYYEGCLLYPIKGKKGEVLPLEFTYSEYQCQKWAVFSTSIPAVIDVKVTLRTSNKFRHHFVTPPDLREIYLIFISTFPSDYFTVIHTFPKKKNISSAEQLGKGRD
jgi:hypothetical protein